MIRKPAVAGRFYPSDASTLSKWLKNSFESVESKNTDRSDKTSEFQKARGCVAPHAGYIYSGKTAVDAIASLEFTDTYILIGPNHTGIGTPASISTADWETPFGIVSFDKELLHYFDGSIAVPDETAHKREHSLEVQLPILQEKFRRAGKPVNSFKIFPICMGYQDPQTAFEIGSIIKKIIENESEKSVNEKSVNEKSVNEKSVNEKSVNEKSDNEKSDNEKSDNEKSDNEKSDYEKSDYEKSDSEKSGYEKSNYEISEKGKSKKIAILATSDFSHYIPASAAEKIDMLLIEKIISGDIRGFYETIDEYDASLCGYGPISAMIIALEKDSETDDRSRPSEKEIHLLSYTNSGEVSGDFDSVVGYAAISVR